MMKKRLVVAAHVVFLLTVACTGKVDVNQEVLTAKESVDEIVPVNKDSMLNVMIGQMIIVGVPGTSIVDSSDLAISISKGKVGGVVLYEKNLNIENPKEDMQKLCTALQSYSEVPLFIGIDQEGGTVNRLKTKYGFPSSVTASYLGEKNDLALTKQYADSTGWILKELGVNLNFAPVVDLCSNPDNPIIAKYGRCYSDDPMVVAKHSMQVVRSHHAYGVHTVLKHFPGHGSSRADTHVGMADVTDYWGWNEVKPYEILIDSNLIDAVMTAHIINAKLDLDTLPATLSYAINKTLLRDSLGFQGVLFSDDMNMHAIASHYGLEFSIEKAINSGVDVLMFSNNIAGSNFRAVDEVYRIIRKLVAEDKLSYEQIEAAYKRIITLKNTTY